MSVHHFDTNIAEDVGVNAAILYQNISFWIDKNQANEKHYEEGRYWTYNSVAAFKRLFPYLGEKAIRGALKKLIDNDYLIAGTFNKISYDRTRWYALGTRMVTDLPKRANGFVERANGDAPKGEPIPDIKPDIKPFKAEDVPIPETINQSAWNEWLISLRNRGKQVHPDAIHKTIELMARYDFPKQQEMVDNAIRSGWAGLHPPRNKLKAVPCRHRGSDQSSGNTRDNSIDHDLNDKTWAQPST